MEQALAQSKLGDLGGQTNSSPHFFSQLHIITGQKNAVKLGHILPLCAAVWIPRCHKCPEMGNTLIQLGG